MAIRTLLKHYEKKQKMKTLTPEQQREEIMKDSIMKIVRDSILNDLQEKYAF